MTIERIDKIQILENELKAKLAELKKYKAKLAALAQENATLQEMIQHLSEIH